MVTIQHIEEATLQVGLQLIAYSYAALWRKPRYCLAAYTDESSLQSSYAVLQWSNTLADYDLSNPLYVSSSFEDISDVWLIYR